VLIRHTTNKPLTTCSRSQAHSPTYLTCGGYITRNANVDGESTLEWAETGTNTANVYILYRKTNIKVRGEIAISNIQNKTVATSMRVDRNMRHTTIILPHFRLFQ
jgi:hypothetical protein